MQAVITRPDTIVRIGLSVLIAGLFLIGLMAVTGPAVSATSLVASTDVPAVEQAEADQLSTLIAQQTVLTTSRITFLEENVALPGYVTAPVSGDHAPDPVADDVVYPFGEDPTAY